MTRVAVVQIRIDIDDPDRTRHAAEEAVRRAAASGAEVVVLPELTPMGSAFRSRAEAAERAESVPGPSTAWLAALSRDLGLVLVAGLSEQVEDGTGPYNSAVLLDHGRLLAGYRKLHLWGEEKDLFDPGGARPPVVATSVGRVGLLICYDLEIPELVRDVALRGAQLIVVPSNWPEGPRPADQHPIEVMKAQAAAACNRVFVAVADRCGTERGVEWCGASLITSARGYLVGGPGTGEPVLLMADLDLAEADDKALGPYNDVFSDRRMDVLG